MSRRAVRYGLIALAGGLAGCTMSTEWWVKKSLQRAGYSGAAAQCVATGVGGSLTPDQLFELRSAITVPSRPPDFAGAEAFVEWLDGRVDERTRQVLLHYASTCRRT